MSALSNWFQKRAMQQARVMHGHAMMLDVKLALFLSLKQVSNLPSAPSPYPPMWFPPLSPQISLLSCPPPSESTWGELSLR